MLTKREFEQLKVSLETMRGYNLNGHQYIATQNVKALLSNWVESDDDIVEPPPIPRIPVEPELLEKGGK